ncbi:MAG: ATP phosphoribosyltransferase regulatory subunit [Planctomycetota bacterium]
MQISFKNPKGTRDFYPDDLLRRRYITEQWRAASVRHGFEEIDGPTFEHASLYTVKSGEGILSELFSFTREGGDDLYALRPEFTPTLARLYAAKAASLPKPVRWFCIPNFFRAEKPQRGRLREFVQWNCDVLGSDDDASADADVVGCLIGALGAMGLTDSVVRVQCSARPAGEALLRRAGVTDDRLDDAFALLDRWAKLDDSARATQSAEIGLDHETFERDASRVRAGETVDGLDLGPIGALADRVEGGWIGVEPAVVRGLAYYTGLIFEVLAEGERAVAGGGRYDKLVELFGGPATPACGFGMGDVVLANLLDDHGLFPSGDGLRDAIDRTVRAVSLRPEVFVLSGGEEHDALVGPLVASLRRGVESTSYRERDGAKPWDADRYQEDGVRSLHARVTSKTTRNLKKLLHEAEKAGAKTAAIVHGADKVQLKDLRTREDVGDFAVDRSTSNALGDVAYVGSAIAERV